MDMDHTLVVLTLLWSSGVQTEESFTVEDIDIKLVRGASRVGSNCSWKMSVNHQGILKKVDDRYWDLKLADAVCKHLGCGTVVQAYLEERATSAAFCLQACLNSKSKLNPKCLPERPIALDSRLNIICSDAVRLINGNSFCSGRVEVMSGRSWFSVCEDGFNQRDAEVVCRELGCGAPSVFRGGLYGDQDAPVLSHELRCKGNESTLRDCDSSVRDTCSSGEPVGLTCSVPCVGPEPDVVRLTGSSRCTGDLEVKQWGEWKKVNDLRPQWNLKAADAVCRKLGCGSAVSTGETGGLVYNDVWWINSACFQSESVLRECVLTHPDSNFYYLHVKCSESIRLVGGNSLCSGRLEVKSGRSWSSVCEDDFDWRDAQVACRELGCGAPLVLQRAVFKEVKPPTWSKKFTCQGHESALLDCGSSDSAAGTCSFGTNLTCSEPDDVLLSGGASSCVGRLQIKHEGDWRPADSWDSSWNLMSAAVVCRQLDCGSALSTGKYNMQVKDAWIISCSCGLSESAIRECATLQPQRSDHNLEIICSDSVRLVDGGNLCSGRLEVRPDPSGQSWFSVCEDGFDLQDAQVVCRELGCGAPSVLLGVLVEDYIWTNEFQCKGSESALLDCGMSSSSRDTCLRGKTVRLTCSEPDDVRLSGGTSRCDGTFEMKHLGEWRPVVSWIPEWDKQLAPAVCERLHCGIAISTTGRSNSLKDTMWQISPSCVQAQSMLRECLSLPDSPPNSITLEVICSEFLPLPNISLSTHMDEEAEQQGLQVLMGSGFTISCSTLPQQPGGSFQLILTNKATTRSFTLPAVNHTAHFLFEAADHTHRGDYRCVYHVYVFSHNLTFESRRLHLTVSAPLTELVIRLVVLAMSTLFSAALIYRCKQRADADQ